MITQNGNMGAVKPSVNQYVIPGDNGILYDAGFGDAASVRYFIQEIKKLQDDLGSRSKPYDIRYILVSHAHEDHFSGLLKVRQNLGLTVMVSKQTAKYIGSKEGYRNAFETRVRFTASRAETVFEKLYNTANKLSERMFKHFIYGMRFVPDPEIVFDGKTEIKINNEPWEIFPSPGHSKDHISLYNQEKGILFSGDNVLRTKTTWLGPPNSDLDEYMVSLKQLLELPKLELILSAHGSPITKPKERIREIMAWRINRTRQLLDFVENSNRRGVTVKQIVNHFYTKPSPLMYVIVEGWIRLTLQFLLDKGMIRKRGRELNPCYSFAEEGDMEKMKRWECLYSEL